MKNNELYDYVENFEINEDFVIFQDKDLNTYKIDLFDIITYIIDYYDCDSNICNQDGLCDFIGSLASCYQLSSLINLFEDLDISDINSKWFIIDYRFDIFFFNNLEELSLIYDFADILEEILEYDRTEDYCVFLADKEF